MSLVLEYAAEPSASRERLLSPFVLQLLLAYTHANLCWQISRLMLVSVCSHLHDDFLAWTPVAWLPGDLALHYFGRVIGLAVMFLFSVLAGQLMYAVLLPTRNPDRRWTDLLHDWRTWAAALLWLTWVPVPALYAFAYQFTEWATQRASLGC